MIEGLRSSVEHVVWPNLVRKARDTGFILYNPGHGTSIEVEEESAELVESVLTAFSKPTRPEAFALAHPDFPGDLLVLMVRSGIVVEAEELPFLEHGFLKPTPNPLGVPCAWSDLPELDAAGAWAIIGVPSDNGALGQAGARHGPSEIRKVVNGSLLTGEGDVVDHDFNRLYPAFAPSIIDLGDVEADGGRLDHVGARLAKAVREVFDHQMRPIVLGGDHSLTHYVLAEALKRDEPFGILHFDAHPDLGPSRTLSHANVFSAALESPLLVRLVQIGLRGIERVSPFARRAACAKRSFISARDAQRGQALALLEKLPKDIPYYLSFDIDCIDAATARETGTPLFGGLSFEVALDLIDHIARNFSLLGADFVEVSGPPSTQNAAATIAANLLTRCVLGEFEFEGLSSDLYVF